MGNKTNEAKTTTAPPKDVLAQYQALLSRASGVSNDPTVAPFSNSQQQAFGSFDQIPGQYLPQAQSYAEQGAAPITSGQIQNYSNPFQQNVIDATMANINETNAQQQNQVVGNAIAQGALGGNRVGVAQGELARQQGLANGQTFAGLNAQNYQQALAAAQQDRAAAANAAGAFGNLQTQALQGAGAQLQSGTIQQNQANTQLQEPYQQASWLASILGGVGPLEGSTQKQVTPGPSGLSQILGAATTAAGFFLNKGGRVGYAGGGQTVGGIAPTLPMYAPIPTTQIQVPQAAESRDNGSSGVPSLQAMFDLGSALSNGAGAMSPSYSGGMGLGMGQLHQRGGRVGYAEGGGIAVPSSNAHRMMATAMDIARTMKAGISGDSSGGAVTNNHGIYVPHGYDFGGAIPQAGVFAPQAASLFQYDNRDALPAPLPSYAPIQTAQTDAPVPIVAPTSAPAPTMADTFDASPAPADGGIAPTGRKHSDWSIPLIAAGLGMMSSQSPFLGTAIGEGGMQGLNAYLGQKKSQADAAKDERDFGLKSRSVDLDAERLSQQAKDAQANLAMESKKLSLMGSQPQSTVGKLASDRDRGIISQEDYDKATASNGTLLSPDAVDLITDQVIAGDMSAMTGYARNPVMKAQIVNALADKVNAQGGDGAALAANAAAYMGDKAAQRSAGTRAAQVGMAASEANQMADIALEASKEVPRSDFVPWNRAVQSFQTGTSSPEVARLVTATTSLVNAYARAVSPLGAPTDAMRQHAEEMLNRAQGQEAYAAVIDQMHQEMEAALNAPAEIRQNLIDRGLGKGSGSDAPPVPGAQQAPDGNWYVLNPPGSPTKYSQVMP